jgi:hypothetical protein
MPKLLKLFRNKKSTSSLSAPTKRSSGIFRRKGNSTSKKNHVDDDVDRQMEILPAITFTLSEEEASGSLSSPMSDIENQLEEFIGESVANDNLSKRDVQEPLLDELSNEIMYLPHIESVRSGVENSPPRTQTKEMSVGTEDDNKTMTFTHLEIMRNELAHMMQLATRDKEIKQLAMLNEQLKVDHANELAQKDTEIRKIQDALVVVEGALSQAQDDLAHANAEQTRIIEVLMKTQYDLYHLKHQSWITPVLDYFSLN